VEMMNYKRYIVYGIVVTLCIGFIATPIILACEEQEDTNNKEWKDQENKDIKNYEKGGYKTCSTSLSQSSSFIDALLDHYPLLNQIIEMIIELLYNWLSDFYSTTSL
jgi:hypothetical protein